MPRVQLAQLGSDAPQTVATVAHQLGISTSTLRTWERRYGLCPSGRTEGAHRRYSPADVARLKHMCKLMERGYPTCDAAREAQALRPHDLGIEAPARVCAEEIVRAAAVGDAVRVRAIVDHAIGSQGLVSAWANLVYPALMQIEDKPQVTLPGRAPAVLVHRIVQNAVERIVATNDGRCCCDDDSPRVLILAEELTAVTAAHVLAAALFWEGVTTGVMTTSAKRMGSALDSYLDEFHPCAVLMVNPKEGHQDLVKTLEQHAQVPIYLIGHDAPCVLSPYVTRLHTLRAAVAEISDLCTCGA